MADRIDIHNHPRQLQRATTLVRNLGVSERSKSKKAISQKNADAILRYDRTRALEGLKDSTRTTDMYRLLFFARDLNKDFDQIDREDIKTAVEITNSKYSAWSAAKIRTIFKRFYKWFKQGDDYLLEDEYPKEVRWIKKGLNRRNLKKLHPTDCWSEDDIKKLLAVVIKPRDRALLSLLTETGARVGEVGGVSIGDVYQDEFGYLIHLDGKTGEREDRVIYSGPAIAEWLNRHPQRDNPNAPLFINPSTKNRLSYIAIHRILKKAAKDAGFKYKKSNPHVFRHSRATILSDQGWPEPMIKEYLGWTKDSDMLATYLHITSRNANRYMLKAHGFQPEESSKPKLEIQLCATCHKENSPDAKFCERCGRPLTHKAVLQYNDQKNQASEILNKLVKNPDFVEILRDQLETLHKKEIAENHCDT